MAQDQQVAQRRRAATTVPPTSAAIAAENTSTTSATSFWKTGRAPYSERGSTNRILVGVGLGAGLETTGTAAEEVLAGVAGVRFAVLDCDGGTTRGLDEPAAGGDVSERAGEDGAALVVGTTGRETAGAELAGAVITGALEDTVRLVAGELGAEELGAGREVLGVAEPGRLGGTVGVGRTGLSELDGTGTVPAQLSRMFFELTTAPSRPITRTW